MTLTADSAVANSPVTGRANIPVTGRANIPVTGRANSPAARRVNGTAARRVPLQPLLGGAVLAPHDSFASRTVGVTAAPLQMVPNQLPLVRPSLSNREVEVLLAWLIADSKEGAASTLFISAATVSTHLARIRAKYTAVGRSAPTKTHLLARALQDGYTSLDNW